MDEDYFVTSSEAAAFLSLSPATLAKWRVNGRGPKFTKLGRSVRYLKADLLRWTTERRFGSTSEFDQRRTEARENGGK